MPSPPYMYYRYMFALFLPLACGVPAVEKASLVPADQDGPNLPDTWGSVSPSSGGPLASTGSSGGAGKNSGTHRTNAPNAHAVPVTHHHEVKHHEIKHHMQKRHAGSRNGDKYKGNETYNASAIYEVCEDLDPSWKNQDSLTCQMYTASWCTGDGFKPYSSRFSGAQYGYPEKQCCACGGGKEKEGKFYEPPYEKQKNMTDAAPQGDEGEDDDWDPDAFCLDTPNWSNQAGLNCVEYTKKEFCHHGKVVKDGMGGAVHNFPEQNCCECGGGSSDSPLSNSGTQADSLGVKQGGGSGIGGPGKA